MRRYVRLGTNLVAEDQIACVQLGQDKEGQKLIGVRLRDGHTIWVRASDQEDALRSLELIANLLSGAVPSGEAVEADVSEV